MSSRDGTNAIGPPPGFDPEQVVPPPLPEGPFRVTSLALDVAGRCNLACRYCAEGVTQPRRRPMTAETLDSARTFLLTNSGNSANVSLRFGSGEPLLAFPLLRQVAALCKSGGESGAKCHPAFFLTTNGTLLDDESAGWLAESGWHVKVSLDGPESTHDAWRVTSDGRGTYARVAKVVARLARIMPERLSVTAVLCRGTDPKETFEAIARLGVKRIELVPVAHRDKAVRPGAADVKQYEAFMRYYTRNILKEESMGSTPVLVRFAGRVTRVMGYNNRRVPCGAGRSFLAVDQEGNLYPCFRFIGLTPFRLGSLHHGLGVEEETAFQRGPGRGYEERVACRTCWAAPLCGGPCFAITEMFGPGGGEPLSLHCAYILADARAAVWLVDQLSRKDRMRLLHYLPDPVKYPWAAGSSW